MIGEDHGNVDEWFYDIDPGVYDYIIKCIGKLLNLYNGANILCMIDFELVLLRKGI